jgi:hypothetical protein
MLCRNFPKKAWERRSSKVVGPIMSWQLPLVIAAVLFAGFTIWRIRPAFRESRSTATSRGALRDAKKRVEAAKAGEERALALCDAGDACAASFRTTSAIGYYLRAMRADPASSVLVQRAAMGLGRRPHALESLLWRRLGAEPWSGASRGAAITALRELADLYEGPLRNRARARAFDHALVAMGEPPPVPLPTESTEDLTQGRVG